jgi:hypothetical protein
MSPFSIFVTLNSKKLLALHNSFYFENGKLFLIPFHGLLIFLATLYDNYICQQHTVHIVQRNQFKNRLF